MIRNQLGIEPSLKPGAKGQFDIVVDGQTVAQRGGNFLTRSLGAGYPDLEAVMARIKERGKRTGS
jgi:predicted Rdx family selenoprotein